jgi:hypothetical protein
MSAGLLSLPQVAALFGLSARTLRARLPEWEEQGFPLPLPWNKRKRLYHSGPIIAWKMRQEQAGKCLPLPDYTKPLRLVQHERHEGA